MTLAQRMRTWDGSDHEWAAMVTETDARDKIIEALYDVLCAEIGVAKAGSACDAIMAYRKLMKGGNSDE